MATKAKTVYVCSNCGFETAKWYGKCPECGEWNSLTEEVRVPEKTAALSNSRPARRFDASVISQLGAVDASEDLRYKTGISEFDRVLGGGLVRGSIVLLGGDPGIGKSTLLLQVCQYLCKELKVLYVSGEESRAQIKMRAVRLGVDTDDLLLASLTDIEDVISAILQHKPDVVIIDSIQTMNYAALNSSSGSVSQVRECTQMLARIAKSEDVSIFVVGHVNKDGAIAGPKVLEHIVDAVLYFEGEKQLFYRMLRAVKNRYGSTNEIGVFEMEGDGLHEVENPSMMLLSGRPVGVSGTCVACIMEGTRPILAEIQALVARSNLPAPRRMSTGFDYNRAALLIAVLEKRAGYSFGNLDAYINIVGGLRLDEPAADLPVALALISGLLDRPIDEKLLAFGEVGLAGEIRAVPHAAARIQEAKRLGFTKCLIPKASLRGLDLTRTEGIEVIGIHSIVQAFSFLGGNSST